MIRILAEDKTVYVLGAGFSKDAGFPLSRDFTSDDAFDYLRKKLDEKPKLVSKIDKIHDYVRYRIDNNYCKDNIESLLIHVSTAEYLYMESITEGKKTYSAEDIFKNLLWYITRFLKEKTIETIDTIPSEYYIFLNKICKKEDTIITFNYDLVLEKVVTSLGHQYRYGVDEKLSNDERLILKLHGSLNWINCDKCGPVNRHDKILTYESDSKETCPLCQSKKIEPILIPPLIYKDSYYNDQFYGELVRESWALASEELSKATKIIFIGFSLADDDAYAQELFKLSLNMNQNENLDCLVVNRTCTNELKKRYESVFVNKKHMFKELTLVDYVRN